MASPVLLLPLALYLLLFLLLPFVVGVGISVHDVSIQTAFAGSMHFVGLANIRAVLSEPETGRIILRTALFVAASTLGQFGLGLVLALLLCPGLRWSASLRTLTLLPWLLPSVASATSWLWLLDQLNGLVNHTLLSLRLIDAPIPWLDEPHWALVSVFIVTVWTGTPFSMILLQTGLSTIPADVFDAARLDGAGPRQIFRYVTWPLLWPLAATTLLLGVLQGLKQFDIIWIMTQGGPGETTQTLSTWLYTLGFVEARYGQGAAVGDIVIFASALGIALYVFRLRTPGAMTRRALAAIVTALMLFPLAWMVVTSLEDRIALFHAPPYFLPPHPSLHAYAVLAIEQWPNIAASLLLGCAAAAVSLLVALPAAYLIAYGRRSYSGTLLTALLVVQLIPTVLLAMPMFMVFRTLGLAGSYVGLVLADSTVCVPFAVIVLSRFFAQTPPEIREAAWIDGATDPQVLIHIVVPAARSAVGAVAMMAFLFTWSEFMFAATLLDGSTVEPLTLSLFRYLGAHTAEWDKLMATAVLSCVPALVLLALAERATTASIEGSVRR